MEFNEVEVLRGQIQLLLQRIAELENSNTQHIAMLQLVKQGKASNDEENKTNDS